VFVFLFVNFDGWYFSGTEYQAYISVFNFNFIYYLCLQVNNDRSRDYTIPNTPNAQPSILGQQAVPIVGPPGQPYNGSQTGWGTGPPAAVQSMPMQMHNNVYMSPGSMPQQMAPGMQFQSPNSSQSTTTLPAYGSDR